MDNLDMLKPSKRKRQKRRDKRLHEELIECYRSGGRWTGKKGKGYDKNQVGNEFQYSPKSEGIKKRSGGTKWQNDNLQPLIRYLDKNTGKYWNKVYSGLCKKMDKNSVIGQHLFDHLFDFVHVNVYIEDKKVMGPGRFGGKHYELSSTRWWPAFYVHPKSGVLMKAKIKKYKFNRDGSY